MTPKSGRAARARALGPAVASGLLLVGSFPKFGHGALACVALVPLLVDLARTRGTAAASKGLVMGAVAALGTLYWTADVIRRFGGMSGPVAAVAVVALCLAVAVMPVLFAALVGRCVARFGTRGLAVAPLAWVGTEIVRTHTYFEFPWCLLGTAFHDHPALSQLASVFGVYGLSFLIVSVASALAWALVEGPGGRGRAGIALAFGLLVGAWGFSVLRLAGADPETGPSVRVALIQPSIPQDEKWDPAAARRNLDVHMALSRDAAADGARLLIWPESAVPGYFDHSRELSGALRGLVRTEGIDLVFGNDDVEFGPADQRRVFVGAKLLARDGRLTLRYHKMHLVPFGEYTPLEWLFTLGGRYSGKIVDQVGRFTRGEEALVGALEDQRLSVSICYEAIFPGLTRAFVNGGAGLLVNVTNDGWYGRSSAPYQHFAMARIRAIEAGRYLVRAANTGISAIVDPYGRVVSRTELFERRALVGDVHFRYDRTPYARWGDVLAWASLLGSLVAFGATLRRAG